MQYTLWGEIDMQRLDNVKIKNETEELSKKNIHKGYTGFLVDYISASKEWTVCVDDPYNYGAYAVVRIGESNLESDDPSSEEITKINEGMTKKPDFYTHTELQKPKFKEYDKVMLMVDKPEYAKQRIKKGSIGCVMFPYAISNLWGVCFTVEGIDGDVCADVDMNDIEVVD